MNIDIDRLHNNIIDCNLNVHSGKTLALMSIVDNYIALGHTPIVVFVSQYKMISLYKNALRKFIEDLPLRIQSDSVLVVTNEDGKNIEIRFCLAQPKYLLGASNFFPVIADDCLYDKSPEMAEFRLQFKLRFGIDSTPDGWLDATACL